MKRLIFILLFFPLILDAQTLIQRFPVATNAESAPEYVWGALAWYEFLGDVTDSYDGNDGSVTGNVSYPGDTCIFFYETDGNDYINLGDFIPTDCDTITISYLVNITTSDVSNPNYNYVGNCVVSASSDPGFWSLFNDNTVGQYNISSRGQDSDGSYSYTDMAYGGPCVNLIQDDTWTHIIEVWKRVNSTRFDVMYWVDGTQCTGCDSTINKGGFELFGKDIYWGKTHNSSGGVEDTYFNHLMLFRGDGRFNPDGNIVDMLIDDPYHMPTQ